METRALRHFRWFARNPPPLWVVVLAVVVMVGFSQWTGAGYELDPEVEAEIAMRVAHVELALEQDLGGAPDWMRAALMLEGGEAARRSLLEDLKADGGAEATQADEIQRALLGEPPGKGAELLARLVAKGPSPGEAEWNSLRLKYDGTVLWAWEAEALARLAAERAPAWLADELAGWRAERRALTRRVLAGLALTVAVLVAGLPFLPLAVKSWWGRTPAPTLLGWWPLGWVVVAYAAADLISGGAYFGAYVVLGAVGKWPFALDVLLDAGWRIGGVVVLTWLLFGKAGRMTRMLGLSKVSLATLRQGLRPLLGMMALLLVFDALWYPVADRFFPESTELLLEEDGWQGLFYALLSAVVLAPLCEEIVFRGALFGGLWGRLGFWPAAALSSAVFSGVHSYGVGGTVSLFVFGLAACVLFRRCGTLWVPIAMHAVYNLLITIPLWAVYHEPYGG